MYQEVAIIFRWWFVFFVVGFISIPITYHLFRRFIDLGYAFAKTIGLLLIAFCIFTSSILKLIPFTSEAVFTVAIVYALFNAYLFYKKRKEIFPQLIKNLKVIVISELIFSGGLVIWTLVRGFQPDIEGLEKFMDFGFINSILSTRYLPPADMWFAGNPINYYWFGHFVVALLTKISNIPSGITFNLMIASILGLTLTSSFSIVASLLKSTNIKLDKRVAVAAGLISALLLTFGGNLHAPIYIAKEGSENYWYPDATRFIGYNPETNDKTIHEFPIYSFVVSDLHAHLINLPFVLLFIALLANYLIGNSQNIIPLGFVLGVMFMTSTWDFGNYLLVSGVTLFLLNLKKHNLSAKIFWLTAKPLLIILIFALLTALPFILNFNSLAEGIRIVSLRTPLWQLGVLWGFPAILTVIFAIFLYKFRSRLVTADIFIASLLLVSWILIFIPEFVFVKDIYIASHQRANTMFKLTYQAFVMTYLSSGYIAVRAMSVTRNLNVRRVAFVLFMLLFAAVLTYPSFAINSYYGEFKEYKGLSGETWLKKRYPNEYAAILWLRENTIGQPIILEAPGDSYTDFNVISSYTGFPTISGWYVHEWLWRGGPEFPQKRVEEISLIYTGSDIEVTKALLNKYNVEYIIVGTFERQKYPNLNEEKLRKFGTPVFTSESTSIYKLKN
jgi:uncharacterized membrane protein